MPIVKSLKTTKLFYKHWPYKITVDLEMAYLTRNMSLRTIIATREDIQVSNRYLKVVEFFDLINELKGDDIKRRCDYSTVSLYAKNHDTYSKIVNSLKEEFSITVTEPSNTSELDIIESDHDVILCDKLPLNKYQYKISFREMLPNDRPKFAEWLSKYDENSLRVPNGFRTYLKKTYTSWGTHYVYAVDQNMATLVALAASGHAKRIQRYTVRADINTDRDQTDLIHQGE